MSWIIRFVILGCVFFLAFEAKAQEPEKKAQERILYVYNWSDYFDKQIIKDFSEETGIKVIYDVFDSNEILETKLLAGNSGYDLVVPSGQFLARQIDAGVFKKLDKSKLPNLSFMWDAITQKTQDYDPGNHYSVNYMWGTTGIGYNKAKIKELLGLDRIDSWDIVFNVENLKKMKNCGIYILDQAQDIFPVALYYLGLDPNSRKKSDFLKAENLLMKIRPYIRKFNSSEYIDALANGDICLAIGWSGDILQARNRAKEANRGINIEYSVPKEGTEIWFDQFAIPRDSKNSDEAHIFINYIMKPHVIARISNTIYYPNGNKESWKFMKKDILEDKSIYPEQSLMDKLYTVEPFDNKAQRMLTRSWTKVITGQ